MIETEAAWHADATALRDYAEGVAVPAVAWSVETHLTTCARCRDVLAHLLPTDEAASLVAARSGMLLPPQPRAIRTTPATVVRGLFGPWWVWLVLVAGAVAVLSFSGSVPVAPAQSRLGLTWALALSPLAPVLAVSVIYGLADRDLTASTTPRGGLELLLVRTAAILGVTLPVVTITLWAHGLGATAWLLPGLGLCAGSLALGLWVGVERAAFGLSLAWAIVVAAVMTPGSAFATGLAPYLSAHGAGVRLWVAAILIALAALLLHRHDLNAPGRAR